MARHSIRPDGYLTNLTKKCRLAGVAGLCLTAITAGPAAADTASMRFHPIADITATAEKAVKMAAGHSDEQIVPTAGYLDPRLKLSHCNTGLKVDIRPESRLSGRVIVGVRCTGANPWKIYLPVHVAVMREVLTTRRSLPRGHLLGTDDVESSRRDVSGLPGGYLSDIEGITGNKLKRSVSRGVVVTPSLLEAEILVKRGQSVTLAARNRSLDISMSGKALMDGAIDQRIKVENTISGRVVEGLVRSAELVEVLVH